MNFIVDAQLPRGLCRWLADEGHAAMHVNEWPGGPPADAAIAAHAEENGSILISKDEDFVSLRLPDRFVFIWIRCGNTSNKGLVQWLEPQWRDVERRLASGARFIQLR